MSATSLLFDKKDKDVAAVCSRMVSFSVVSALFSSLGWAGNVEQMKSITLQTSWSFWGVAVVMAVNGLTVASVLAWSGPVPKSKLFRGAVGWSRRHRGGRRVDAAGGDTAE